jgi:hypothetical protein
MKPFDLNNWREDYDWQEAFVYARTIRTATRCDPAPFAIEDVSLVHKADPGENDSESWMMVGQLKDGRWFFLDAWCDYTGWDCQAGGDAQVAATLPELIRYGMTEEARSRLSLPLEDDANGVNSNGEKR